MLYTAVLVAAATLSSFASAQNSSAELPPGIQNCCTVNPGVIPDDLKNDWCLAQRNTCPEICGGINQLKSPQSCDKETLEYKCECRNGTVPNMAEYQQSVPGQMCRFWFDQCINATNENLEQQVECQNQRDTKCGNKTTAEADATSKPSSSPSPTQTGGNNQGPSNTEAAPTSTSGAATALAIARNFGTPVLAGGLAALFGLVL